MADNELILVTGAAGQLGAVGRTVTSLLLDRGFPVRAMVRREDDRVAALRADGAEVVVGDLVRTENSILAMKSPFSDDEGGNTPPMRYRRGP